MLIDPPLQQAVLIKRYKRFLADIELADGSMTTIHCPNTGSMKNCLFPGNRIWFSDSGNPKRKYPCTWYFIEDPDHHIIGINTGLANQLVREAVVQGNIPELMGYKSLRQEVPYGDHNSRIDLLLADNSDGSIKDCYVEVKNVSLAASGGQGLFPDAVTTRGHKHLNELLSMHRAGYRAVLFFCVQHAGIERVAAAQEIDPDYARLLREVVTEGVEVIAYRARFDLNQSRVELLDQIPVQV